MTAPNYRFDVETQVYISERYRLGWAVGSDGSRWPVLRDVTVCGPTHVALRPEDFREVAPHEVLDPDREAAP